jgi:hypothetical protein
MARRPDDGPSPPVACKPADRHLLFLAKGATQILRMTIEASAGKGVLCALPSPAVAVVHSDRVGDLASRRCRGRIDMGTEITETGTGSGAMPHTATAWPDPGERTSWSAVRLVLADLPPEAASVDLGCWSCPRLVVSLAQ